MKTELEFTLPVKQFAIAVIDLRNVCSLGFSLAMPEIERVERDLSQENLCAPTAVGGFWLVEEQY